MNKNHILYIIFIIIVTGKLEIQDEKEIMVEAERLEVTNKAPMLMCELIFDGKILTQIKTYKRLLLRFTNENTKAQKYLMGGIEKTIETHKDVLLPKVAHILKSFYDEDIIDEEVILEWGKKVKLKFYRVSLFRNMRFMKCCKKFPKIFRTFLNGFPGLEQGID